MAKLSDALARSQHFPQFGPRLTYYFGNKDADTRSRRAFYIQALGVTYRKPEIMGDFQYDLSQLMMQVYGVYTYTSYTYHEYAKLLENHI